MYILEVFQYYLAYMPLNVVTVKVLSGREQLQTTWTQEPQIFHFIPIVLIIESNTFQAVILREKCEAAL